MPTLLPRKYVATSWYTEQCRVCHCLFEGWGNDPTIRARLCSKCLASPKVKARFAVRHKGKRRAWKAEQLGLPGIPQGKQRP